MPNAWSVLSRIEPEHFSRGCSRGECAGGGARVKTSSQLGGAAGHRHTTSYFITGNHGGQKPLAVNMTGTTNERIRGRDRFRAGMDDTDAVQVVHLEAVDQRAVGQRRIRAGNLRAIAPDERSLAFSHLLCERSDDLPPRQRRAKKRAAERIDEAELDMRHHFRRDVSIRESCDVFSQRSSRRDGRDEFFNLCFYHKPLLDPRNVLWL